MEVFNIAPRDFYIKNLDRLLDNDNIVIMIGLRRTGKTCIATEYENHLKACLGESANIVRFNFDALEETRLTAGDIIDRVNAGYDSGRKNYIILGEITHIEGWESAVNHICGFDNCKLILCSSHRRVFSTKLDAINNNRYDIISVLPMSLPEFISFHGFSEVSKPNTAFLERRYKRFNGKTYSLAEVYRSYVVYGGLPIVKTEYMDPERAWVMMDGTYSAVVTRDVLEVGCANGTSAVTDPVLLRSVIKIMAKTMGENVTATGIGRQTADYLERPSTTKTIENYIRALNNANMFYTSERFDLRSEQTLKTFAKYYIIDTGLYRYLIGLHEGDSVKLLENKVFFELLRRGYSVSSGKLGSADICFIARNGVNRAYIQIARGGADIETQLAYLRRIRDSYPKVVLTIDHPSSILKDGIVVLNALEFLMGASWTISI